MYLTLHLPGGGWEGDRKVRDEKENKRIDQVSSRDNPKEPLLLNTWAISLDQLGYRITT